MNHSSASIITLPLLFYPSHYIQMCNYPYFRIPPMKQIVQHYIMQFK